MWACSIAAQWRVPDQLTLLDPPPTLKRADAVERLRQLVGSDLRPLADQYGITVWRDGRRNKGWAGQVVERFLGQSPNSAQAPDFGDWELKVVPLVSDAQGAPRLKETMSITMFTAEQLEAHAFEESHLLEKLRRLLVVARIFEDPDEAVSLVAAVAPFDLEDHPEMYAQVREDYDEIRWLVQTEGAHAMTGRIGRLVQPRPKGAGYLAGGFGFYARKSFVEAILGL